jgi:hypothetical protein
VPDLGQHRSLDEADIANSKHRQVHSIPFLLKAGTQNGPAGSDVPRVAPVVRQSMLLSEPEVSMAKRVSTFARRGPLLGVMPRASHRFTETANRSISLFLRNSDGKPLTLFLELL